MKVSNDFLVVMATVALISVRSYAQFEGAVWDTLTVDTLGESISLQALATTPYQLHIAYGRERAGGGQDIYYRFYDMLGGWMDDRVVESGMPCSKPVMAAKFTDEFDIAILTESNHDIYGCIIHDPNEPWEMVNLTNSPDEDMSPTVALGDTAFHGAWITEIDWEYKIAYIVGANDSSHAEIIEESYLGEFGSGAQPFIIAAGDVPHIFYRGGDYGSYNIHHAFKPHPDSSWTIEILDTPNAEDFTSSAAVDNAGNIRLAISGNEGWGMPSHIFYMQRDHETGAWSGPILVTGGYSAANGSLALSDESDVFIASRGVSGNIYSGEVYLSANGSGSFQTDLLADYGSSGQTALTMISGIYGALVCDAPIGGEESRNMELVYYGPSTTGIADENRNPRNYRLFSENYPNPFNASTAIRYNLPSDSDVKIEIFDVRGRKVDSILSEKQRAGDHQITWNADRFPSGVYFYIIKAGENSKTEKMTLLK